MVARPADQARIQFELDRRNLRAEHATGIDRVSADVDKMARRHLRAEHEGASAGDVSDILDKEIERERRRNSKVNNPVPEPFFIAPDQLQKFEYTTTPISASAIARKINWLVKEEIKEKYC